MQPATSSPTSPLVLHASTTHPLQTLLPSLLEALQTCDTLVHRCGNSSTRTAIISVEVHRYATELLYAALVASGLDLNRAAHTALACLCNQGRRRGSARSIELQIEIRSFDGLFGSHFAPTLAISA